MTQDIAHAVEQLLPCPAGHRAVRTNATFTNFGQRWYGNCIDCAWQGPLGPTEAEAIAAWNCRPNTPAVPDGLGEALAALAAKATPEPALKRGEMVKLRARHFGDSTIITPPLNADALALVEDSGLHDHEAFADLIVKLVNNLPAILAALKGQQP